MPGAQGSGGPWSLQWSHALGSATRNRVLAAEARAPGPRLVTLGRQDAGLLPPLLEDVAGLDFGSQPPPLLPRPAPPSPRGCAPHVQLQGSPPAPADRVAPCPPRVKWARVLPARRGSLRAENVRPCEHPQSHEGHTELLPKVKALSTVILSNLPLALSPGTGQFYSMGVWVWSCFIKSPGGG